MPNEEDLRTAKVLGEDEGEFRTQKVLRIDDDFFWLNENGGARGAWQNRPSKCEEITRARARAMLLEMGLSVEEVAKETA